VYEPEPPQPTRHNAASPALVHAKVLKSVVLRGVCMMYS
jgi:hypothetical protein